MKKSCMNCKNYRPLDETSGRCRADRGKIAAADYPLMQHEDFCDRWKDCGQQYYIRIGWLKSLKRKEAEEAQ